MVRAMSAQRHPAHRDPEMLLRQLEAAERAERRGQLKIFLGYASGVGKSFKLFDEGQNHSRIRPRARHYPNLRRPQPAPELAQPVRRDAAGSARPACRRDRRACLPAMTGQEPRRGHLKVFLGYAAGVGKT